MCISSTQRQTLFIRTIIAPAPLIVNTQKSRALQHGFFCILAYILNHVTRTHKCR